MNRGRGAGAVRGRGGFELWFTYSFIDSGKKVLTCDDHKKVSGRALDSDMQWGDVQVICERERGRA